MPKLRKFELKSKILNWNRVNNLRAGDVTRTIACMMGSVFRTPPHVEHWPFIELFGPVDEAYLTNNLKEKGAELKRDYNFGLAKNSVSGIDWEVAAKAIDITNSQFGLTSSVKLKPISVNQVQDVAPKTTSSGSPDFITPKSDVFWKAKRYAQAYISGELHLPNIKDFWPVVLAWRTQMRASGEKHRLIAVFPHVVTVLEYVFAQPFFEFFMNRKGQTFYSYGSCWIENRQFWIECQNYRNTVEIDWTSFDNTVPNILIQIFYLNLEKFIDFTNFPNLRVVFKFIMNYHMYATVLSYDGESPFTVENKQSGVLSGSVFTNFLDSWVNLFVINYCCLKTGSEIPEIARVMGDDYVSALDTSAHDWLSSVSRHAKQTFGMIVSSDKSTVHLPGERIFYMGFSFDDRVKERELIHIMNSLRIGGRFISSDIIEPKLIEWSRFCNICAAQSNGYPFWLKYKDRVLSILGISEPTYIHDLTEGMGKPFSTERLIFDVNNYVKNSWIYS